MLAKVITPVRVDFEKEGLSHRKDVVYGVAGGKELLMDMFWPEDNGGKMPVIIWVHGGGWASHELDRMYRPEPELANLAKMGFFIASIDYRLVDEGAWPVQIEDCKRAVRYLRANAAEYGINPEKIGVWGESAGAHLAMLMAMADKPEFEGEGEDDFSGLCQAVCEWYGPADFIKIVEARGGVKPGTTFYNLFGGTLDDAGVRDKMTGASPITYVRENKAPVLIMHGDEDKLVPYEQSKLLYTALKEAGADVKFITIPGQGHGFFDGDEYYEEIYAFFRRTLMG